MPDDCPSGDRHGDGVCIETRGDEIGDLVKLLNNVIMKFGEHV
jgi:hypothetical protein